MAKPGVQDSRAESAESDASAELDASAESDASPDPEVRRSFRLVLEFDGRDFEGWQIQRRGGRTVQGCVVEAVASVVAGKARVTGSSRTDSGVHAEGFVASLQVATDLDPRTLQRALNAVLPPDVVILELTEAPPDFDARRDACWKNYRYSIWNAANRSPKRSRRALHVRQKLNLEAMRRAAGQLIGRHDFACFQAAGSTTGHTVRGLYRVDVLQPAQGEVTIEVEGSGFLRYMVRNLVGTLIEVGRGRRAADGIADLIASRDRRRAGPTAAPHALCLIQVCYTPHSAEAVAEPQAEAAED